MISAFFASAWYFGLLAVTAILGRPAPRRPVKDPADSYEEARFADRNRHAQRLREEELAEMRRRQNGRAVA